MATESAAPPSSEASLSAQIEALLAKEQGAPAGDPNPNDSNAAAEGEDFTRAGADVEDPEATEPEGDAELPDLLTLDFFAERLETDAETLAKQMHVKGADGKPVPLSDVLEQWRRPPPDAAEQTRSRMRLAELEGTEQTRAIEHQQRMSHLHEVAVGLAQHLKATQPDLEALRAANDPRYVSLRLERIEQERQIERAAQMMEVERQARIESMRFEQGTRLRAAVPEWADEAKFRGDLHEIEKDVLSRGFTREEVLNVLDHREWLLARDAWLYRKSQAEKPAADKLRKDALAKRVSALPPVMRPGMPSAPDRGNRKAVETSIEQLRQTGSREHARGAFEQLLAAETLRNAGRSLANGRRRV